MSKNNKEVEKIGLQIRDLMIKHDSNWINNMIYIGTIA